MVYGKKVCKMGSSVGYSNNRVMENPPPICKETLEIFGFQRLSAELWSTPLSSLIGMENPKVMKYITITCSTSFGENKLSIFYEQPPPESKKLVEESIKGGMEGIYDGYIYSHTIENVYGLSNSIYLGFKEGVFFPVSNLEMAVVENVLKEKERECEIFWKEACS